MKKQLTLFVLLLVLFACSRQEARKPIVRKTSSFMNESIERNKLLNKVENELLIKRMKKDTVHVYSNSEQGFWYAYVKKDSLSNDRPEKGDEVFYRHEIRNLNDSIVYSMDELGLRSYLVDQQELISGLQEGLKLMKEGETMIFLFPSHKAYGYTGSERIGRNEPLIYKVELIQINKSSENENN